MEDNRSGQCGCCQRCPRRARGGYRLMLVSTLGQWMVILVCLFFFGVRFHGEPQAQETQDDPLFTEMEVLDKGPVLKADIPIPLEWRFGQSNYENHSLVIIKDGCYLLCLHGSLESMNDKAAVKVYHMVAGRESKLLMQGNMTNNLLNLLTLQRLLKDERIFAEVAEEPKATLRSLSLKIIYLGDIPLDKEDLLI